jgi:hypothetical protein
VDAVQFRAPHNYNKDSREAVYSWMARWLQNAAADVRVTERPFTPDRPGDLLVFEGRPLPDGALTRHQLTESWIASARRQIGVSSPEGLRSALLHALALERRPPAGAAANSRTARSSSGAAGKSVVLASDRQDVQAALTRAGFIVKPVRHTPFDAEAAAKIDHFDTYNRTAASQRVADIVQALDANPGAMLVADGEDGPPALLVFAVVGVPRAVIDVAQFDNSDAAFLERLYIPGIRRAGDFQTSLALTEGPVVIHNAGDRFTFTRGGPRIAPGELTPEQVASALVNLNR